MRIWCQLKNAYLWTLDIAYWWRIHPNCDRNSKLKMPSAFRLLFDNNRHKQWSYCYLVWWSKTICWHLKILQYFLLGIYMVESIKILLSWKIGVFCFMGNMYKKKIQEHNKQWEIVHNKAGVYCLHAHVCYSRANVGQLLLHVQAWRTYQFCILVLPICTLLVAHFCSQRHCMLHWSDHTPH